MRRGTAESYYVFTRNWWTADPKAPGGRKPGAGPRRTIGKHLTREEAIEMCREYNTTHDPGPLSYKAEFDEE